MMSHTIEISDDENSLSLSEPATAEINESDNEAILLSSDNDTDDQTSDTMNYLTSDEEVELPEVSISIHKKNVIKKLFPNAKKATDIPDRTVQTQRKDVIEQLFPKSSKPVESQSSTSRTAPQKPKEPSINRIIGGVTVTLPVEPYGCQIALMAKVITAIKRKQNCLLESPTGSGKTLALLCAALAWQRQEKNRIGQILVEKESARVTELKSYDGAIDYVANVPHVSFSKSVFGEKSIYDKPVNDSGGDSFSAQKRQEPLEDSSEDSSENGLVRIQKRRRLHSPESGESSHVSSPQKTPSISSTPEKISATSKDAPSTPQQTQKFPQPETPENVRFLVNLLKKWVSDDVDCSVPTIFYGARTHKQLQQVIKEFKRTSYCGEAKMTLLASREYSCIRVFDRQLWKTKNDMCRGCIKPHLSTRDEKPKSESNCKFYDNRAALHHGSLPPAFDLEELVAAGEEKAACPYYAARGMASSANIVFCPYNYLIEPSIRSSMQIDLKDNIVVIDEAHNIEDICRDAASFSFTQDNLNAAITELSNSMEYLYSSGNMIHQIEHLLKTLKAWNDWFTNQIPLVNNQPVNINEAVYTWETANFVETLNNHNIGQNHYIAFKQSVEQFTQCLREDPRQLHGITQATGTLVESLETVLRYIFREEGQFMDDFKPALIRTVAMDSVPEAISWRNSQFNQRVQNDVYELRLLCMNPGVIFAGLKAARCILLASGTLTPLVSFYSELGADFPLKVSPSHVISSDRVWVGTLSTCPDGSPLECQSRGTSQTGVQDGVGEAVLWVARVTPHGVLCFLPSYQLMNKLARRWKETGLWNKLEELKNIFMESRNVRDHNDIMDDYYKYVESDRGAILFAVFRGKVSEGMDFRDHQARAVITIGIPYPNVYDMAVKEKMAYNNRYEKKRNLLSSSEWLRVQAYRALNQAVGRCVRHRGDWGAVLLLDARFANPYYTDHLSKWVKDFLKNNHHTYESLVKSNNSLESFMQNMTIREQEGL